MNYHSLSWGENKSVTVGNACEQQVYFVKPGRHMQRTVFSILHDGSAFLPPKELFVLHPLYSFTSRMKSALPTLKLCITLSNWHKQKVRHTEAQTPLWGLVIFGCITIIIIIIFLFYYTVSSISNIQGIHISTWQQADMKADKMSGRHLW